ncbi:hypothetical protein HW555_008124 [Spodoptera exigua]|uniref:Uncharacterized protein n=1 Tax=Spodoptera exigua TaxID=7107 RepID=A0A835L3P4_SPOEX|nr:hypothetical protein HW555_008124 [Spodoptera exigua]
MSRNTLWVIKPRVQDRDTCLCVIHANVDLKLNALCSAKILPYNTHQKLLENLCCDKYRENCLSRDCQACKNRTPDYKEFDNSKHIQFQKWVTDKQEYTDPKTKKSKFVTEHLKKSYTVSPRQLIQELQSDLETKFFCHQRNIVHHKEFKRKPY